MPAPLSGRNRTTSFRSLFVSTTFIATVSAGPGTGPFSVVTTTDTGRATARPTEGPTGTPPSTVVTPRLESGRVQGAARHGRKASTLPVSPASVSEAEAQAEASRAGAAKGQNAVTPDGFSVL